MQVNKKSFIHGALIGISIMGITILSSQSVLAVSAQIGGQVNGYSCEGASANRWKIEDGNVATLPNGYNFEKVVVKAGQACITVYPTNTATSCYTVDITGSTATITKIGSGPTCQDISHLEGTYSITQSPSASPSISPSASPSVSPSASPSADPSVEPSASPSVSPSPSPSVSPSPSTSSTPAPSNNNNSSNNDSGSNNSGGPNTSSGQVLGAYAATGVVQDVIMNALGSLGGLMTAVGTVLYGSKKKIAKHTR